MISLPLSLIITYSESEGWIIIGKHNGTSLDGQFTERKLVLKYNKAGILTLMSGNSFFQKGTSSYEYGFTWNTVDFLNQSTTLNQPSFWDSLNIPLNVIFGSIILGSIVISFAVRARKKNH